MRARRFALATSSGGYRAATSASGGTSYVDLVRTIERSGLDGDTRTHALAILALLGEAEARVHGTTLDAVHFHELADWDSLMDVVAAGCIAAALADAQWTVSALPLGGGQIRTAHGMLPVPTPATSALLEGYAWRDDGLDGERVTPTGAAILRHVVAEPAARCSGGRLRSVGSGAGTRSLGATPNILRVSIFEREAVAAHGDIDADFVSTIEFDVDDMTGEEIALAADRLRAREGAVDVSIASRTGKKGRPSTEFRVLAQPTAVSALIRECFKETSTLGVRVREDRRQVLRRHEVRAGDVKVKVAQRPGGARTGKAAHDDVSDAPTLDARRSARSNAEQQAVEKDE
jgi:pyridinium-3,5-bisthiocarboxylic acid mononucleotide nickel chelatase